MFRTRSNIDHKKSEAPPIGWRGGVMQTWSVGERFPIFMIFAF
jgi:hypothetical protein